MKDPTEYRVEIKTEEPDVIRRIAILNAALYRILKVTLLRRVIVSDYASGRIVIRVLADKLDPMVVPGGVSAYFDEVD